MERFWGGVMLGIVILAVLGFTFMMGATVATEANKASAAKRFPFALGGELIAAAGLTSDPLIVRYTDAAIRSAGGCLHQCRDDVEVVRLAEKAHHFARRLAEVTHEYLDRPTLTEGIEADTEEVH